MNPITRLGLDLVAVGLIFGAGGNVESSCNCKAMPYDMEIDYMKAMYSCAILGDETSRCLGHIYEVQRNTKLIDMGWYEKTTRYFEPEKTGREIVSEMIADKMRESHSVAAEVYESLSKAGCSDIAVAGVLGNMMNEVGGNTLELNPYIYEIEFGSHYGLCQWSVSYCPEINGAGLDKQLAYLVETIAPRMKQFGGSFDDFNALESPEEAGLYFCKYYERGINSKVRGINSVNAYEWIKSIKGE